LAGNGGDGGVAGRADRRLPQSAIGMTGVAVFGTYAPFVLVIVFKALFDAACDMGRELDQRLAATMAATPAGISPSDAPRARALA
jgi:hypothetical protein